MKVRPLALVAGLALRGEDLLDDLVGVFFALPQPSRKAWVEVFKPLSPIALAFRALV